MNQQKVRQNFIHLLNQGWATAHNRIVVCGLLISLTYLLLWLNRVAIAAVRGGSSLLLVLMIGLGLHRLWRNRHELATLRAPAEDRLLGHFIILGSIGLVPFFSSAEWSQKILCMLILAGIAISTWGIPFFKLYPLSTFLIGLGLFPEPSRVGTMLWQTFMPPEMLERLMAWAGATGLQLIGQPAVLSDTVISLPTGAVRVDWSCNGFYMAATVAFASLILGVFFKQSTAKVILLIVIGATIALLANVPRIMLLAMAEAYWGKQSFEFWHGFWGGQIFTSITLTVYYYAVKAIVQGRSTKAKA